MVSRPTSVVFSCDLPQNWTVRVRLCSFLDSRSKFWTRTSKPLAVTSASAPMHRAKGLEFRAVVVMACDDEIIPLRKRIETVGDDADLQEVYDTGASFALRCLYTGQGSSARRERYPGIGVPR